MAEHSNLVVLNADPFNAETRPTVLIERFVTAQRDFYVRSHGDVPPLGADHALQITGDGVTAALTLAELKARFPERTVAATMQCAGNRRADLQGVKATSGDPWNVGAIGTAHWTGASLIDVIEALGMRCDDGRHVAFTSADPVSVDGDVAPYGVSIPIAKARDRDVLLAWAMNGEPLAPEHGAPIRLVTPGYAGARSPKWLTRIELRDTPSDAPIQAHDYKLFPASVAKTDADWSKGLTIDAMPINAAICDPVAGATLPAGPHTLRGYAIAYDRSIARVDVSIDGGGTWRQATLQHDPATRWCWTLWSCAVDLPAGDYQIVVRAIDDAGQMQPERAEDVWNFGGYLATMWHRVAITTG
ncbi:molybdopterin oxidoreductase [Sphingomonas koreensis]|nr:molybdopterin oxidoreductase [Sphingomonas koreensis]